MALPVRIVDVHLSLAVTLPVRIVGVHLSLDAALVIRIVSVQFFAVQNPLSGYMVGGHT